VCCAPSGCAPWRGSRGRSVAHWPECEVTTRAADCELPTSARGDQRMAGGPGSLLVHLVRDLRESWRPTSGSATGVKACDLRKLGPANRIELRPLDPQAGAITGRSVNRRPSSAGPAQSRLSGHLRPILVRDPTQIAPRRERHAVHVSGMRGRSARRGVWKYRDGDVVPMVALTVPDRR
jgi:hypothetical protein